NVQQVKLLTEGQRSQQREWPCWFSVLCWQLLLLLFTVSVSFYTFIHVLSSKPSSIIYKQLQWSLYSNLFIDDTCPKCEEGWELHGGKCYYFSTSKSTWDQSRDDCRRGGGDLSISSTLPVQSFLELRLREKMNCDEDKFWIGLTDSKEEGKWLWVDDSPLNTSLAFWSGTEPDNWPGKGPEGEDCARMGKKSGADDLKCWFDVPCKISYKSICLIKTLIRLSNPQIQYCVF
uniref:C-type lectin domain-containing protein n=1 Tax=Anabas testudineus TaxID=64144 RepID=A0A3Q1H6E8_ANATE